MTAIVNADINWGIGAGNDLLFHIPDDKKFFRRNTLNKVIVMGRKTLESLPNGQPFKDRINIVLTRDKSFSAENVIIFHSIDELLLFVKKYDKDDVYVIGGGEIYSALLPFCDKALVTKTNAQKKAEVFFPDIDKNPQWTLVHESDSFDFDGITYKFCTYNKT